MIQRGKVRTRVETRILVPHHDFVPTARVQANTTGAEADPHHQPHRHRNACYRSEAWAGASLLWNAWRSRKSTSRLFC